MVLIVQKFGGTSVADSSRMQEVARHIRFTISHGDTPAVVVSAMGKETDALYSLAGEVASRRSGREMDMLITAGERKAVALLCLALHDLDVPAVSFTGSQAGFITDSTHQSARITEIRPDRVREALESGLVPVVAGAQGVSGDGDVTFLGRGGSDTTAVALAHALGAEMCELYTDVSGVFTADPRIVPNARRMSKISFDEMLEMTAAGCPKPAMRSVFVARAYGMPLHVRSAFTWEPGTLVSERASIENSENPERREEQSVEQPIISAVTHDTSNAKVTLQAVPDRPGVAAAVFRRIADLGIDVDMIEQNVSEKGVTDISFTIARDELNACIPSMEELMSEIGGRGVIANSEIACISLIGAGMKAHPGVAAQMFETLAEHNINIEMISTSAIRISCVVNEKDMELAVRSLHSEFNLDEPGSPG